jgi:hypothetical protein
MPLINPRLIEGVSATCSAICGMRSRGRRLVLLGTAGASTRLVRRPGKHHSSAG